MYEGNLNYQIEQVIKSCSDLSRNCNNVCPLHKVCQEYLAEQDKEKEKPTFQGFTRMQIEMAAQALFEEMLDCGWDYDIIGRHTDFWTDEQKRAYQEMDWKEEQDIDEIYVNKVLACLKRKSEDWWDDIVVEHKSTDCPLNGSLTCQRNDGDLCENCPHRKETYKTIGFADLPVGHEFILPYSGYTCIKTGIVSFYIKELAANQTLYDYYIEGNKILIKTEEQKDERI